MNRKGSLLIITLWMVTILSTFAIAIARYLSVELRVMRYRAARAQAETMARSGAYAAMRRIKFDAENTGETYDWKGDPDWAFVQADNLDANSLWEFRVPETQVNADGELERGSRVQVTITDEESKFNLNQASTIPEVANAAGLLLTLDELAARMVDYIDADSTRYVLAVSGATGLETDQSAIPPYIAKNGSLARCEELLNIPGFSELPVGELKSFCGLSSAYTVGNPLNINTVDSNILLALGLSGYTVGIIDQFRNGTDGEQAHEQDGVFEQPGQPIVEKLTLDLSWTIADAALLASEQAILTAMGVESQTFQVQSTGQSLLTIGKRRTVVVAHVQAIVRRSNDCGQDMPDPCILSWNEW